MRHKPERIHHAQDIAQGVRVVHELGLKALTTDPAHAGPLRAVEDHQKSNQATQQPEMETGHCLKCKGKKQFQVESKKIMKNGAEQVSGTCQEPGCGAKVSTIRKANGTAAA